MTGNEPDVWRVSLEDAWPALSALCPPQIEGRPATFDEVKSEIDAGNAVLLGNRDGILLLALEPGKGDDGASVIAWCALSLAGHGGHLVETYLPHVERWAAGMGARRVVMQSPRLGWLRRLPERWRVVSVTYQVEVADGEQE